MTIRGIQTLPGLPKTSVIVPCHNYGRYLSWALASILHQTKPAREILVIDDSSDDETAEVTRSYGDKVRYYRVSFKCAQRTRNFGLEQAQGEYVLFLDADDFLDNTCLEILERELDENPSVKLAYSGRFHFGSRVDSAAWFWVLLDSATFSDRASKTSELYLYAITSSSVWFLGF